MKYVGLRKGLTLLLVTALLAGQASAQSPAGGVTKEEEAEVRATATAFAEKLGASQDFATVARELYAEDFMSRQLKALSDWSKQAGTNTFMLEGIPSLTFERALAAQADVEDWKRVRFAADNLLYFVWLSTLANHSVEDLGNPEKYDDRAIFSIFPPEALKALDANPAASNFLLKKNAEVVIRTPGELRATAAALEEAVRLTRQHLAESLAKGRHLETNLRKLSEGLARKEVKLAEDAESVAGSPEGTRGFRVFAPNAYDLRLVRQGGALKIVYAGLPHD